MNLTTYDDDHQNHHQNPLRHSVTLDGCSYNQHVSRKNGLYKQTRFCRFNSFLFEERWMTPHTEKESPNVYKEATNQHRLQDGWFWTLFPPFFFCIIRRLDGPFVFYRPKHLGAVTCVAFLFATRRTPSCGFRKAVELDAQHGLHDLLSQLSAHCWVTPVPISRTVGMVAWRHWGKSPVLGDTLDSESPSTGTTKGGAGGVRTWLERLLYCTIFVNKCTQLQLRFCDLSSQRVRHQVLYDAWTPDRKTYCG